MFTQIGIADGAWPDVHATPVCAQVHRRTNNTNTHQLFLLFSIEQLVFRFSHSFIIASEETIDKGRGWSARHGRSGHSRTGVAVTASSVSRRLYIYIILLPAAVADDIGTAHCGEGRASGVEVHWTLGHKFGPVQRLHRHRDFVAAMIIAG